jgi:hypothetical protein
MREVIDGTRVRDVPFARHPEDAVRSAAAGTIDGKTQIARETHIPTRV